MGRVSDQEEVCCSIVSNDLLLQIQTQAQGFRLVLSWVRLHFLLLRLPVRPRLCLREPSYMETLLLFVQKLKLKGLYAADDPSLVADQLHANTPHISRPRGETQVQNNTKKNTLLTSK